MAIFDCQFSSPLGVQSSIALAMLCIANAIEDVDGFALQSLVAVIPCGSKAFGFLAEES